MNYRRVVLGIGNPGPEYEDTRHNVGFMVLDSVAEALGLSFRRLERKAPDGRKLFSGKTKAKWVEGALPTPDDADPAAPFVLVKPTTYVNLSGDVAGPLLRVADLEPDALFVIVDDLNLPLGRIRCRPSGSSGGHNGLKSIEQAVATNEYPRLRLGIGLVTESGVAAPVDDTKDFVLARFLPQERTVLGVVVERARDIVLEWLAGAPIETLMARHNGFDASQDDAPDAADGSETARQ